MIGFLGAILVVVIILLLAVVFRGVEQRQLQRKQIEPRYQEISTLQENQRGYLAGYGWLDSERGIARIPIEEAKQLVLQDLAAGRNPVAGGMSPEDAAPTMEQPQPEPNDDPTQPEPAEDDDAS
jgi:hypothetical protein